MTTKAVLHRFWRLLAVKLLIFVTLILLAVTIIGIPIAIIKFIDWQFAQQEILFEDRSIRDAMRGSTRLVRRHRWHTGTVAAALGCSANHLRFFSARPSSSRASPRATSTCSERSSTRSSSSTSAAAAPCSTWISPTATRMIRARPTGAPPTEKARNSGSGRPVDVKRVGSSSSTLIGSGVSVSQTIASPVDRPEFNVGRVRASRPAVAADRERFLRRFRS